MKLRIVVPIIPVKKVGTRGTSKFACLSNLVSVGTCTNHDHYYTKHSAAPMSMKVGVGYANANYGSKAIEFAISLLSIGTIFRVVFNPQCMPLPVLCDLQRFLARTPNPP